MPLPFRRQPSTRRVRFPPSFTRCRFEQNTAVRAFAGRDLWLPDRRTPLLFRRLRPIAVANCDRGGYTELVRFLASELPEGNESIDLFARPTGRHEQPCAPEPRRARTSSIGALRLCKIRRPVEHESSVCSTERSISSRQVSAARRSAGWLPNRIDIQTLRPRCRFSAVTNGVVSLWVRVDRTPMTTTTGACDERRSRFHALRADTAARTSGTAAHTSGNAGRRPISGPNQSES